MTAVVIVYLLAWVPLVFAMFTVIALADGAILRRQEGGS